MNQIIGLNSKRKYFTFSLIGFLFEKKKLINYVEINL